MSDDLIVRVYWKREGVPCDILRHLDANTDTYDLDEENVLVVVHRGRILRIMSDYMQPEDARFTRDLSWIVDAIKEAYEKGLKDGEINNEQ